MKALNLKLWRDLRQSLGQVLSISVLMAAGMMFWVTGQTSLQSMTAAQSQFYQTQRFAEVFVELVRAPQSLASEWERLPGVHQVQTRIREPARLRVAGFEAPIRGEILSLPDQQPPLLNDVLVLEGQRPSAGSRHQVLVSEAFASAQGLRLGDPIEVVIAGRQLTVTVVGVALSPEFVYLVAPGELMPDPQRYGVLWMTQSSLAELADMVGAFNSAAFSVSPGSDPELLIAALDASLQRYGGRGAYGRADQPSHFFIEEELGQLRVMVTVLPLIFLAVAAFLVHVMSDRMVRQQRQALAALKAFGYSDWALAKHFMAQALAMAGVGVLLSIGPSWWVSQWLVALYAEYFRFPEWPLRPQPLSLIMAAGIAALAALLGAARAVRAVVADAPAEAMRPPMPARFQRSAVETVLLLGGLGVQLSQASRMALRNLLRHPLKAALSSLGIGLALALMVLGLFQFNAVQRLLDNHYQQVMRMDVEVAFAAERSQRVAAELRSLPGVEHVTLYHELPVRLHRDHRSVRTRLLGLDEPLSVYQLIDRRGRPQPLAAEGVLMTRWLAEALQVMPGDSVAVEVLGGPTRRFMVDVAGVVDEPMGSGVYWSRAALSRVLSQDLASTGAWLLSDAAQHPALLAALNQRPQVLAVTRTDEVAATVRSYLDDTFLGFMAVLLGLAGAMALAVVYHHARMALAERSRELATLRVLGHGQVQVTWVLAAEVLLLMLLAIPLSWGLGLSLAWGVQQAFSTELFRLPWALNRAMFGMAALSAALVTALAAFIIYRRVGQLDLVTALKTEV